jgi:hypothetical protein
MMLAYQAASQARLAAREGGVSVSQLFEMKRTMNQIVEA